MHEIHMSVRVAPVRSALSHMVIMGIAPNRIHYFSLKRTVWLPSWWEKKPMLLKLKANLTAGSTCLFQIMPLHMFTKAHPIVTILSREVIFSPARTKSSSVRTLPLRILNLAHNTPIDLFYVYSQVCQFSG